MPTHRKNAAPRQPGNTGATSGWDNHVKRQRARKDMAKASKRKNRKRK